MLARTLALVLALTFLAPPAWAATTRYNPRRAGHPLRIVAYALHPFGVVVDTLLFHPAWWLGTHEPLRSLFGVDVVFDDSAEVARQSAALQPAPQPSAPQPDGTAPDEPAPTPDAPAP
jgi:hypothetical protein